MHKLIPFIKRIKYLFVTNLYLKFRELPCLRRSQAGVLSLPAYAVRQALNYEAL